MRLPAILLIITFTAGCTAQDSLFAREWTYASRTSAVIYWQLADIAEAATSYVEYGPSDALGSRTEATREARGAQFHRLTGLAPESSYSYRLVTIDAAGNETRSPIRTLATIAMPEAIPVPGDLPGPPYILDQPGATYILTGDVSAPGGVFVIEAPDITLDLDGHTVTFGNDTDGQVQGVLAACEGPATICNGHIVQGARCKDYSTAVSSRWRPQPTEIFGISTDVYLRCGYPVKFLGAAKGARIHHNRLYSRVTEIESRHYPGNDLLRLDIDGGDCEISDNILTEGCHVGLRLTGKGPDVSVHHNDIRHHQQYVNGYAIAASCAGADIHHNRVTSTGRGIHLTAEGIDLHDNHLDLRGHQHLSDMPQGTRPWQTRRVELHGIKFEGAGVKNCRVHDNRVRITQPDRKSVV